MRQHQSDICPLSTFVSRASHGFPSVDMLLKRPPPAPFPRPKENIINKNKKRKRGIHICCLPASFDYAALRSLRGWTVGVGEKGERTPACA